MPKNQRPAVGADKRPKLTLVPDLELDEESPLASAAVEPSPDERRSRPGEHVPVRLEVDVDREFFSYATSGEIDFPEDFDGPIEVVMTAQKYLIGRQSNKRSIEPDIDLSVLTLDPAVSIEHAQVQLDHGTTVTVTDLGSTNGTVVGVPSGPDIDANTQVPVAEGSSVYLGAWTKLTVVRIGW